MTAVQDPPIHAPDKHEQEFMRSALERFEERERDQDLVHRIFSRYLYTPVAKRTMWLLVRRRLLDIERVRSSPAASHDVADAATATTQEFAAALEGIQGVARLLHRTNGTHVDFIVESTRPWHEVIDELEPRLRGLLLSKAHSFDYSVVERAWGEPLPKGYLEVPSLGEPAARP